MNTTFLYLSFFFLLPIYSFSQLAPDFTITSSSNQEIQLYNDLLDNGKTVVLKFFFTSCPPCKAISPYAEELYQEWGAGQNDVEFISISIQNFDSNADVAQFKIDYGLTFPGAGNDGGAAAIFSTYQDGTYGTFLATPTFVVIAPDKTVQFDPRGSGYAATMAAVDEAITNTGAQKPITIDQVNYFSANGNVYGGNGVIYPNPEIKITTELGVETQTWNPFTIEDIEENTDISIELLTPTDNLKGISTYDLVLINNHILGIDEFEEQFELLAADASGDGVISTFDIILIRQLILSFTQSFPNERNWLIYSVLPQNVTAIQAENNIHTINQINENTSNLNFTIIKIGDVSGDAYIEQ